MDVKVIFTGICAFVENQDESKRCKMVALLPDGDPERDEVHVGCCGRYQVDEALDGEPLFRHRAFLKFKAKDLAGATALKGEEDAVRYLKAERVTFRPWGNTTPFVSSLGWLADLNRIVPDYANPDPDLLAAYPNDLAAQILLDHGTLVTSQPTYQWSFPNAISRDIVTGPLSHEVALYLFGLTRLDVKISRFDGSAEETLSFASDETIEIQIANLCDENPLRWPIKDSKPKVDDDFRWHYELVANGEGLAEQLYSLPLPIPHPVRGQADGRGMNCLGSQLAAIRYDLDSYLPPEEK